MAQIMNLFNNSFARCSEWFLEIFVSSQISEVYFVFIFIVLVMRFILRPVLGSARGSDRARSSGKENDG